MIHSFNNFIKLNEAETGPFYVDSKSTGFRLDVEHGDDGTVVHLTKDGIEYDDLSVKISGEELDKGEFFLNPNIDSDVVLRLKREGFISPTGKRSNAGDKETQSYSVDFGISERRKYR